MNRKKHRHDPRPIRATSMWRVDQVFLNLSGQRIEVTCSMVNDDGGLRNEKTIAPTRDPLEAVAFAARYVAGKGNVYRAYGARVRWTKVMATDNIDLVRDLALEDAFLEAFEETLAEVRDRMR